MIFLRKSILRRVLIFFLLGEAILAGAVFALNNFQMQSIPLPIFGGALALLLLFSLLVFWYEVTRPFHLILEQIRALLTGRKYSMLFTNRIDEVGIIAHFFNEVTKSLEKVSMQLKEGKRMMSELEVAAQLQKEILPLQVPKIPGLEIVAKTRPAVEVGGDNFDFVTVKDNTYLYIGDVTGHGVPAALVMTMVNTLIHSFAQMFETAYDVVVQTNRHLKNRIKSTMFMTMLMLRFNSVTQKMTYVGAGHEHLLIYRAATGVCESRVSGGIALGMVPDNSKIIQEIEVPMAPGDLIVLYTDGVTEAKNMAGEMYGLERLKKVVEVYAQQYGTEGVVFHISREFSRFVENHVQEDDITLIAVRYLGPQTAQNMQGAAQETAQPSTAWNDK